MKPLNSRQTIISVIVCLFAVLVLTASSVVPFAINLIENNGTPLPKRPTLNFTSNMTCADDSGNNSTDCSAAGVSPGAGITVFSGSAITLLGTQYLAIGGGAAISSTESTVHALSPTASAVSNLTVQLSAALGVGASAVVTWRDNGASEPLTCTISGSRQIGCSDNTDSFNPAQGDLLDIQVVTTGTPSAVTIVIATAFGTVSTNNNPSFPLANAASTGTTLNTLTTLVGNGNNSTAVIVAAGATGGSVGITTAGAGTSGTATITTAGQVFCIFDGATTRDDYVQISSINNGNCTDAGPAYPTSGQVIGRVLNSVVSAGIATIDLFPSEIQASSGGGVSKYTNTFTNQTSIEFTHNLGTVAVEVQCWDNSSPPNVIIPVNIAATDSNDVTVTFSASQSGRCVIIG